MSVKTRLMAAARPRTLLLDGSGDYASTPSHASLNIVGDLDLRCVVALTDWSPAATNTLLSKTTPGGVAPNVYALQVLAAPAGRLALVWSADGVAELSAVSTVSPTIADGAHLALLATLDVDNGAAGRAINFWTKAISGVPSAAALVDSGWTQLGTTVTQAGVTAIAASAGELRFGGRSQAGANLNGRGVAAVVKNGIDGTTVADPDFSRAPRGAASFVDGTGKVWTLAGNARAA